jgi:4-amino-4-deoxy-L-arabinose transferase-like glycosyltransferase
VLKKIALILILLLALFLRLYHLDTLPPSLFSDEVDISYQARIFNQNHTDYFGNKFPIHFHSFADWQPGLGIYLTSLFQTITNNSDLSVLLPSAFMGVISVYLFYLITGSLIPSFLLAICPWAIHYSRTGFAVSDMLTVIFAGIYFWKKYTQNSRFSNLLLAIFFLALSPYFYSTANLFLIIIALLIFILWFPRIKKIKISQLIIAAVFGLIILTPLLIDTLKGQAGFRFSYISIYSDPQISKNIDYLRYKDIFTTHQNETGVVTSLSSKIFHNKYGLILGKFITNYFSSFSTDFLFINGDQNARQGFGGAGLLYYLDFFLIIFGLINTLKNRHQDKLGQFFVLLLVLAPIPFALTRDSIGPHATRLILMLPSLIYLSYQGILYFKFISKYFLPLIICLYLISLASFWHYYNYDYREDSAMSWHTGMKEAVLAAKKYQLPTYFSDVYEPFLPFFLYYEPYLPTHAPALDIQHFSNNFFDGSTIKNQYFFGHLNWSSLSSLSSPSLFVVSDADQTQVPKNLRLLETINKKYINSENFYLYTNEK